MPRDVSKMSTAQIKAELAGMPTAVESMTTDQIQNELSGQQAPVQLMSTDAIQKELAGLKPKKQGIVAAIMDAQYNDTFQGMGAKLLGFQPPERYEPQGAGENIAHFLSAQADVSWLAGGLIGKAVTAPLKIALASKAVKLKKLLNLAKLGEKAQLEQALLSPMNALKPDIVGKATSVLSRRVNRRLLRTELSESALTMGGLMGGYELVNDPMQQLVEGKGYDPLRTAKKVAGGVVGGALRGPVFSLGGKGIFKLAGKVRNALTDGGIVITEEQSLAALKYAREELKKLPGVKEMTREVRVEYLQGFTRKHLSDHGHLPDDEIGGKLWQQMVVFTRENAAAIDKRNGTNVLGLLDDVVKGTNQKASIEEALIAKAAPIVKALQRAGLENREIGYLMQFAEKEAGQFRWNVSSTGYRKAYDQSLISDKAKQALDNPEVSRLFEGLRGWYDDVYAVIPDSKVRAHIPGYIAKITKEKFRSTSGGKASIDNKLTAKVKKRRDKEPLNPVEHEMDILDNVTLYAKQAAQDIAYEPVRKALPRQLLQLSLQGMPKTAQKLVKDIAVGTGAKSEENLTRVLGEKVISKYQAPITEILAKVAPDQDLSKAIWQSVISQMYQRWVFVNPFSHMKQFAQSRLMGYGEQGVVSTELGHFIHRFGGLTKAGRKMRLEAREALETMRNRDTNSLLELHTGHKYGSKLDEFMSGMPDVKYGKKLWTWQDEQNRMKNYISGRVHFQRMQRKGKVNKALQPLLPAERRRIDKLVKSGNTGAAEREYGWLSAMRANFAYNKMNKPEMMREGLGSLVPFITWKGNYFMRVMGDVQNKNWGTLANRMAKPIVFTMLLSEATGLDFNKILPHLGLFDVASMEAAPAFSRLVDAGRNGGVEGLVKELGKYTPWQTVDRYFMSDDSLIEKLGMSQKPRQLLP